MGESRNILPQKGAGVYSKAAPTLRASLKYLKYYVLTEPSGVYVYQSARMQTIGSNGSVGLLQA